MSSRQMTGTSRGGRDFEDRDCFRIYHEVEDVGKTVRASKRRARWTFSFGEKGQEREVILSHSVVSGKKNLTYDGRQIYHSEELSRTFSHSWYDGDHVLRVDIMDLVDVGRGKNDKMYELTLDGVPFSVLPLKPVHLPSRRGSDGSGGRQGSFRGSVTSRSSLDRGRERGERSSIGENNNTDEFNPRGSLSGSTTSSKPKAVMKPTATVAAPSPPPPPLVDLLGSGGNSNSGLPGDSGSATFVTQPPQQSFDPFGASASANADQFAAFPADFNQARNTANVTAHDLVKEFGGLSVMAPTPTVSAPIVAQRPGQAPLPPLNFAPQPENGGGTGEPLTYNPSAAAGGGGGGGVGSSSSYTMSTALVAKGPPPDAEPQDVEQATVALVNLNNLLDDGSPGTSNANLYKSVYQDNRSLAEMKASQASKPQQSAKPIFIDRPMPPRPALISPHGPGPQGQGGAFYGQHPGSSPYGGMQMPMQMQRGGGGQQQPMGGMGGMGMMMGPVPPVGGGGGFGTGLQPPAHTQQGGGGMMAPPPMMNMGMGMSGGMGGGGGGGRRGSGGLGGGALPPMMPPPMGYPQQQYQQQQPPQMGGGMGMGGMGMGVGMMQPPPQQQQQQYQQQGPPRGGPRPPFPPNSDPFFGL